MIGADRVVDKAVGTLILAPNPFLSNFFRLTWKPGDLSIHLSEQYVEATTYARDWLIFIASFVKNLNNPEWRYLPK
jgi:hypothetical protein